MHEAMPEWLARHLPPWNGWYLAAAAMVLTVATAIISLAAVTVVIARLPEDYFTNPAAQRPIERHPVLYVLLILFRNAVGWLLVGLGIILSLPGVPGQGLLTILIGMLLIDFPRKKRVLRWLLTRRGVWEGINRLRQRCGRPPLRSPRWEDTGEHPRLPALLAGSPLPEQLPAGPHGPPSATTNRLSDG